jgi:HD-like signal output (HDOD) protein
MGNIIARDPAVTARLLHLVNSAAFSLAEKVTDPIEAISLLGVETVKSLVLCLQIFGQKDEAREAGLSLEILWEHSLLVAKFARLITFKQTVDERLAGDAFTAGLLHDVGRIVIASNLPQEYAAVVTAAREESHPLHEEETARLGVNHAKVGAYLLGLWGLPTAIVEAAAGHHAPGQTVFACEFSLLAAVHAANVFAHASSGQTDGLPLPELDLNYFKAIKLDEQLGQWRQWCLGESLPAQSVKEAPEAPPQPTTPPRPAARFSEPAANPLAYLWKLAAVLLLGLTAGLAWHFSAASSSTPPGVLLMPASTNQPAESSPIPEEGALRPPLNTATNQTDPGPTLPLPSPFDTVKIQGIFYRAANPEAIINNRTVRVGDQVNGLQVVAITQSSVTLSLGSEKRVYGMK